MKFLNFKMTNLTFLTLSCTVALLTSTGQAAAAGIAIIVHPSNTVEMAEKDVSRIFLGKAKKFPGGGQAIPVDQDAGSAAREAFGSKVLKKKQSQLKAYWSKLVFTGKGTPPKESGSDDDVKALVAGNPNTVGYIDKGAVDDSVRVVMSVD